MASAVAGVRAESAAIARLAEVLREIARGGIAAIAAGIIVGGIGGRLAMTVAARLNPDATGLRTEAGALVGTFTAEGTLALLLFGGIGFGLVAGVVWVVVSPWIPATGASRVLIAMPVTLALGGYFLVESFNSDFIILGPDVLLVGLFLLLVAAMGGVIAWLDERLERVLPRPGPNHVRAIVGYGVIAAIGLLALPVAASAYFSIDIVPLDPPVLVGWSIVACGIATALAWARRIVSGVTEPAPAIVALGRLALVTAVVLGGARVVQEAVRIVSLA